MSQFRAIRNASTVHFAGPVLLPMAIAVLLRKRFIVEHHGYQAACLNGLLLQRPYDRICVGHFLRRDLRTCVRCYATDTSIAVSIRQFAYTALRRAMCSLGGANVCVSDHVASRLGLPKQTVIYHGVQVVPATVPSETARKFTFAYIGRLVAEKGLPDLIAACKIAADSNHEFRVYIVGDGPERQRLEDLTLSAGLRATVIFTGWRSSEALEETLSSVDAIVMPSIWEETAGLAAIEQMMRGRCVIAANVGGLTEIIGCAGLKFPVGDVTALANCLLRLMTEPDLVASLRTSARERALALFDQARMVREHATLYEALT